MSEAKNSTKGGDPNVAVFLTWFLPGAGHMYLGRVVPGIVILVLVEALYALGWMLSEGRTYELLDPELRGPLATLLTPEIGNLGGMIAQMRVVGYGSEQPSPFPSGMALGGLLTALSGILNLFAMAHAHFEARAGALVRGQIRDTRRGPHPALATALCWVVPGLGHAAQGRTRRALIVFVLLVGFFLAGTWMAEGSNLSRERHFYYWSGQLLVGLPAVVTELVSGRPPVTGDLPLGDVGLLFACMPGLLNILVMLDVYGFGERRWLEAGAQRAKASPPEPDDALDEAGVVDGEVESKAARAEALGGGGG